MYRDRGLCVDFQDCPGHFGTVGNCIYIDQIQSTVSEYTSLHGQLEACRMQTTLLSGVNALMHNHSYMYM